MMTTPAIVFPGPDSHDAPHTLRTALRNSLSLLGSFPKQGLLLKVKADSGGEKIADWGLVETGSMLLEPLQEALGSQPTVVFGAFPSTGLILKVKQDEAGERLVNWVLADPERIQMLAIGLSISRPNAQ